MEKKNQIQIRQVLPGEKRARRLAWACLSVLSVHQLLLSNQFMDSPLEMKNPTMAEKLVSDEPSLVRASLVHWMGPMNLAAYEAWIVYHHKRWNISQVDLHVNWKILDKISSYFADSDHRAGAMVNVYGHDAEDDVERYGEIVIPLQHQILQQTLANAKRDGNEFVMNTDPDEFLESEDFQTIESAFRNHTTAAVTIPVFEVNYHLCSGTALTFDSLKYVGLRPIRTNFVNDEKMEYYTNPSFACGGNRKYIVRTNRWDRLNHVHDPVDCGRNKATDGIIDMTGRLRDGQHLRLFHLRTGVGIHAESSFRGCLHVRKCDFVKQSNGAIKCAASQQEATHRLVQSGLVQILRDYPLFDDSV